MFRIGNKFRAHIINHVKAKHLDGDVRVDFIDGDEDSEEDDVDKEENDDSCQEDLIDDLLQAEEQVAEFIKEERKKMNKILHYPILRCFGLFGSSKIPEDPADFVEKPGIFLNPVFLYLNSEKPFNIR